MTQKQCFPSQLDSSHMLAYLKSMMAKDDKKSSQICEKKFKYMLLIDFLPLKDIVHN